eukprot:6523789-Lingulodinium_polyedra.AAC.1
MRVRSMRAPFLERARAANSWRCRAFAWRRVARSTAALCRAIFALRNAAVGRAARRPANA